MSAVLPFLEQRPAERANKDVLRGIEQGIEDLRITKEDLKGIGAVSVDEDGEPLDPLSKPHTELTRLYWARTLVAQALVGAKFKLAMEGPDVAVHISPTDPDVAMIDKRGNPAIKRNVVAWHFATTPLRGFKLFSRNSKMECPTWDLPAGMNKLGGSCPGAAFAQSTVPEAILRSVKGDANTPGYATIINDGKRGLNFLLDEVQKDWTHFDATDKRSPLWGGQVPARAINLQTTVCEYCYASGGKYGEVTTQFNELARYAFVQALVNRNPDLLVNLLVRTIEGGLKWDETTTERHGIRPIRVHSSGDFYKEEYAAMWLKVAGFLHSRHLERVAQGSKEAPVVLWAPTRTHVLPAFNAFWRRQNIPPNFIIRPSAYSVGDPAPYIHRDSPTGAAGTSVLFEDDTRKRIPAGQDAEFGDGEYTMMGDHVRVHTHGSKFDWQCGVYALAKGNKTCLSAQAPDGKPGCRACWTQREMAVNYVIH